jgi:site-specific DNA-methyltransferase (adenine-specific)
MMRLINADCLEAMRDIPDGSVDMVLTDPPYGTTACKWDSVIPFAPMWEQLKRITKPNGAIVLTASQPFTSALIMSNVKMFKYEWIWEKSKASNFLLARKQALKAHENIIVFSAAAPVYYPQKTVGKPFKGEGRAKKGSQTELVNHVPNPTKRADNTGDRLPRSVQYFKTAESEGCLHPTQKPVALMEYLIRTYTNAGDTVLDFTFGSGTTGVAAKNLGRSFIGIELDPDYFALGSKRIADTPECAA